MDENVLLAVSNIIALLPILRVWYMQRYWECLLFVLTCITSIMQHLTDTKHGRNGNKNTSRFFLWLDRITASMCALYLLIRAYYYPMKMLRSLPIGVVGVSMMIWSEHDNCSRKHRAVLHVAWHVIAYCCLNSLLMI